MSERVYFVKCGEYIKIGTSTDVDARVRALASKHPDVSTLCTFDGGRDIERAFHKKLAAHRRSGEWFRDCSELRAAMADFQRSGLGSLREFYVETPQQRREKMLSTPAPREEVDQEQSEVNILIDRLSDQTIDIERLLERIHTLKAIGADKAMLVSVLDCAHSALGLGEAVTALLKCGVVDNVSAMLDRRESIITRANEAASKITSDLASKLAATPARERVGDLCGNSD